MLVVTPLDIFKDTWGLFPAVFVASKLGVSEGDQQTFPAVFVATITVYFSLERHL